MDQAQIRGAPRERELYALWRGVRVTEETLRIGDRAFRISDLRRLRERRGRWQPMRRVVVGVVAVQALVVLAAVGALVGLHGWSLTLVAVVLAQVLVTTALVGAALVRWPTPFELWAECQGESTLLYRDADRYEFGKVRRAVERAMFARRLLK
jgi:fatty acid desaturase